MADRTINKPAVRLDAATMPLEMVPKDEGLIDHGWGIVPGPDGEPVFGEYGVEQ